MYLDLSVVIPCYNCEDTIIRSLDSIPKKAGIETIIVDDCSSDKTVEVIKQYQNKYPDENLIISLNPTNIGAGETRNKALKMVSKTYLTFLDSDDQFSSDFAQQVIFEFETGFDCLIFDAEMVSSTNRSILKMFYTENIPRGDVSQKEALVYTRPATWGKIYRFQIIQKHEIGFGHIPRNEDLVFTKSALCFCKKVRYLDQPIYYYYDNPTSLMNNRALLTEKNAINAVRLVKSTIINNGFEQEFNSIYFLEIVYATTLTLLRMNNPIKKCRTHFRTVHALYQRKDPYRKKYMLKYRLSYLLYRMDLFFLFKLVFKKFS